MPLCAPSLSYLFLSDHLFSHILTPCFNGLHFFPQTCCLTEREYSTDVRLLYAEGFWLSFRTACKTRVRQSGNAAEVGFHVHFI